MFPGKNGKPGVEELARDNPSKLLKKLRGKLAGRRPKKNKEFIVKTNKDFERACKQNPDVIVFEGDIARKIEAELMSKYEKIEKYNSIKKATKILPILGFVGGIVATPFTAGASLGLTAASAASMAAVGTATGLAAGVVARKVASGLVIKIGKILIKITEKELFIISAVIVAALGASTIMVNQFLDKYEVFEAGNGRVSARKKQESGNCQ